MENLNTPVEIDSAIAENLIKVQKAERDVNAQESYLNSESAYRRLSFDEVKYAQVLQAYDEAEAKNQELQALYTGWPRYWIVTNVNGHIHTSMSCTSCFPTTQYGWRVDLSGLTPEEVVEREAYNACSVCMPIAPAEQRAARERYNAEQRAERKAERDAKNNAKAVRAAERAQKLVAKVEAAYATLGGVEAVRALPTTGDSSLYQLVYAFGAYSDRKPLQQTVADVLLADQREHEQGKRDSYDKDPRVIVAEAKEKGLI